MKIIILISLMYSFVFVNAQKNDDYFNPDSPILKKALVNKKSNTLKLKYSLTAGTNIGSGFNGGNIVNTWIAPSIIYPLNSKFSVEAGAIYNKGFYNNYSMYNYYGETIESNKLNGSANQLLFYAKGRYKLSENITITGSAYKSTILNNNQNLHIDKTNPNAFNLESNGYSLGFIYKMTKNSSLEFQINYNKGTSPYYSPLQNIQPFGGNGMLYSNVPNM